MGRPSNQNAYSQSAGLTGILAPVQEPRDPTTLDVNYVLYREWVNTSNNNYWKLMSFTSTSGTVLANWLQIEGTTNEIHTLTGDSGGAVGPTANNVNILGTSGQITVTGNPATSTLTLALAGGGTAVDSFAPDTGTNPVVPTAAGLVNVQGQSTPNVSGIQVTGGTNSLNISMFSPFLGDFNFTKSNGAQTITLGAQHTGTNTALVSSTANSAGNGAGFFSSGQYDTTKFWNFGMVPTTAVTNPGGYNISYNTIGQSDPSSGTNTVRITTAGNVTVPSGDLTVTRANSGSAVQTATVNTSNTATSVAAFAAQIAGSTALGAYFNANISGDSTANWSVGTLGSDGTFRIHQDGSIPFGSNTYLKISKTGAITFDNAYTFPTADGSAGQTLVTNGAGVLTFQNAGSTGWTVIGASQTLAVNEGYICTTGAALSLALPAVSAVGDEIEVILDGSTSWTITQPNAATRIRIGNQQTTLGVGGSLASTLTGDSVRLVCETANARWAVASMLGNITVV